MKLSPAEVLAHSTVRLECDLPEGSTATGTGFLYALNRTENQCIPVIVTNKHVVEGAVKGQFSLTLQGTPEGPAIGLFHKFEVDRFESRWVPHPDPDVDLCAMPVASLLNEAKSERREFFFAMLNRSYIPSASDIEDMIGVEDVTMVGYPNGLWDRVNNLPIFRRGIVATDYKYDWNGKQECLVDIACFPGSSGSPVMLFDIGSYLSRKGHHVGASRVKLLGILYAGPVHTVEGEIKIVKTPTQQRPVSISRIPNNLGVIIKSVQLLAFEDMFVADDETLSPAEIQNRSTWLSKAQHPLDYD